MVSVIVWHQLAVEAQLNWLIGMKTAEGTFREGNSLDTQQCNVAVQPHSFLRNENTALHCIRRCLKLGLYACSAAATFPPDSRLALD